MSMSTTVFLHYGASREAKRTCDGVLKQPDGSIVSPVLMWVKAMDLLLEHIRPRIALKNIRCIGGGAQQHGTVYWATGASKRLANLSSEVTLHDGLGQKNEYIGFRALAKSQLTRVASARSET
ncbi:hypothetical protein ANCDUO_06169 [Ancylostoma duodenale]|uniref:Carbohydrate kinase FGGY C-terminal domain-containing protein n=1 Tax=Ancylostoma duodenale TaxID=51022 RepID=A0A0C2D2D9_9BILA|nr:hypothetical protein ANCDUO_06169 [Ancylostoma duodenale]